MTRIMQFECKVERKEYSGSKYYTDSLICKYNILHQSHYEGEEEDLAAVISSLFIPTALLMLLTKDYVQAFFFFFKC